MLWRLSVCAGLSVPSLLIDAISIKIYFASFKWQDPLVCILITVRVRLSVRSLPVRENAHNSSTTWYIMLTLSNHWHA